MCPVQTVTHVSGRSYLYLQALDVQEFLIQEDCLPQDQPLSD